MEIKNKDINFEKIGAYAGIIGLLFIFWSFWKDLHVNQADMRERIAKIEVIMEHSIAQIKEIEKRNQELKTLIITVKNSINKE